MIIERDGVVPSLKFRDLKAGDPFRPKLADQPLVFMKGYQLQGIGTCAVNLANGAVWVPEDDEEVVRVDAKVVV